MCEIAQNCLNVGNVLCKSVTLCDGFSCFIYTITALGKSFSFCIFLTDILNV